MSVIARDRPPWNEATLGDLCKMYQPETITQKQFVDDGQYPVYGANGEMGKYNRYNHEDPQLVLGCRGACGSVHITPPRSWITGNSMVIQPDPKRADLRFLRYFFEGPANLSSAITGAAQPQITQTSLKPIVVPLPRLDEQTRIVQLLDQAFAALDRAQSNTEANLADSEGLLSSFIEEQLDESGGNPATLQQLIDGGAIIGHLDGNHGSEYPRNEEFVSEGVPYISANCIVDQRIDFNRAKFLSVERAARIRKGIAKDGDVIFAHNATVGPVALLTTPFEQVVLGTSVTYYRCDPSKILPEFLMYEMRGAGFRAQYEAVMEQATRSQVPITMQRTFTHCIPSIEVQSAIVKRCKRAEFSARELNQRYTKSIADIAALRQALLQVAFTGQLN